MELEQALPATELLSTFDVPTDVSVQPAHWMTLRKVFSEVALRILEPTNEGVEWIWYKRTLHA
jgi:hypothetical protein